MGSPPVSVHAHAIPNPETVAGRGPKANGSSTSPLPAEHPYFSPSCSTSEGTGSSPEKEAYARWAVCWDWQNGYCNKGDNCKWVHMALPQEGSPSKDSAGKPESIASIPEEAAVTEAPCAGDSALARPTPLLEMEEISGPAGDGGLPNGQKRLGEDEGRDCEEFLEAESEAEAFSPETHSTFSPGGDSHEGAMVEDLMKSNMTGWCQ